MEHKYCERCYKEINIKRCKRCNNPLNQDRFNFFGYCWACEMTCPKEIEERTIRPEKVNPPFMIWKNR